MKSGNLYEDVGTRIGILMEEHQPKRITHSELAEIIGVDRGTLTGYLNGKTKMPIGVLFNISQYFNVSADYLLGISDVKRVDADMDSVCRFTGLSGKAVDNIVFMKNSAFFRSSFNALDDFLQEEDLRYLVKQMSYVKNCVELCKKGMSEYDANSPKEHMENLHLRYDELRLSRFDFAERVQGAADKMYSVKETLRAVDEFQAEHVDDIIEYEERKKAEVPGTLTLIEE